MTFQLNRNRIFFTGFGVILLFLLINRLDHMIGTRITTGQVIGERKWHSYSYREGTTNYTAPLVRFSDGTSLFTFEGITNMEVKGGEKLSVIYKIDDPQQAGIYTFTGFWLSPLIYCLIPLLLLGAAVFSFLTASEYVIIASGKKPRILKTEHGTENSKPLPWKIK
jgi:hypothetical protein